MEIEDSTKLNGISRYRTDDRDFSERELVRNQEISFSNLSFLTKPSLSEALINSILLPMQKLILNFLQNCQHNRLEYLYFFVIQYLNQY